MIVALIPARGGSKGIPRKNVRPLAGTPLIGWTIQSALQSRQFDRVLVSTDDEEISQVAEQYGAEVIQRPAHLATDTASTDSVLQHALLQLPLSGDDLIMLLQPTSPLRTADDIVSVVRMYDENPQAQCVISGFEPAFSPAKAMVQTSRGTLQGLLDDQAPFTPRQLLPRCFQPNGAIYLFSVAAFSLAGCIPRQGLVPFYMAESRSQDIDTDDDFRAVSALLELNQVAVPGAVSGDVSGEVSGAEPGC